MTSVASPFVTSAVAPGVTSAVTPVVTPAVTPVVSSAVNPVVSSAAAPVVTSPRQACAAEVLHYLETAYGVMSDSPEDRESLAGQNSDLDIGGDQSQSGPDLTDPPRPPSRGPSDPPRPPSRGAADPPRPLSR